MTNARATKESRQEKAAAMRAQVARAEARRRSLIVSVIAVVVIAVIVAVFVVVQNHRHNDVATSGSTPGGFDGNYSITVGNADAPVTLVAYEDFQCPDCRAYETANSVQLAAYVKAGSIKIQYHPIAFLDRSSSTHYSTRALNAAAAVVTYAPADFQRFHDLLYLNQPAEGTAGLTDKMLIALAVQAGAPQAPVTAAINHEIYKGWTVKATDAAFKTGLTGTPTLYVNGKQPADYTATTIKQFLDTAIAAAKK